MKRCTLLLLVIVLLGEGATFGGNWVTVGGNSMRNGLSDVPGPAGTTVRWTKPSPYTIWGNQIFSYGDKFVTTRYVSLSPIQAILACHSLTTGDTLWTRNYAPNGVMIVMGFNNDKIYARNFQQQGFDTIYAINPVDGSVIWKSRWTVERGIVWTAAFASNGDLFLPGSGTRSIMRINHLTGDTVWTRNRTIPNTGAECLCVSGNVLFAWEGSLATPKRIMALDATLGELLSYSPPLPGDGDQEIPFIVVGHTVYCIRDGGSLHALRYLLDLGFIELWQRPVAGPVGTYSQFGIGPDTSVYVPSGRRILRLDYRTGVALDSSEELASTGTINVRMAIGSDGKIYLGNGAATPSEGKYFGLTANLQTSWVVPSPYNYYSGPALAQNGSLLFCGGGTEITAYGVPVAVEENFPTIPQAVQLLQNYPNPFNPGTTIGFRLAERSHVSLKIFDLLGREVTTLVSEEMGPGSYERTFDGRGLVSGVYLYRLKAGSSTQTRRLMLLR